MIELVGWLVRGLAWKFVVRLARAGVSIRSGAIGLELSFESRLGFELVVKLELRVV